VRAQDLKSKDAKKRTAARAKLQSLRQRERAINNKIRAAKARETQCVERVQSKRKTCADAFSALLIRRRLKHLKSKAANMKARADKLREALANAQDETSRKAFTKKVRAGATQREAIVWTRVVAVRSWRSCSRRSPPSRRSTDVPSAASAGTRTVLACMQPV
jgi:hypothetical protein